MKSHSARRLSTLTTLLCHRALECSGFRKAIRRASWPTHWLAAFGLSLALITTQAAPSVEAIQAVVKDNQDSVLFFGGALKFLCGRCSREHDYRVMSTAVVVDAAGLLLARIEGPLADPKTEIRESSLRVIMPDGAEVPVRVAVTDTELRVLILAVEKPEDTRAHPFKPVKLDSPAAAKVMDDLIVLRRFDKRFDYALDTTTVRVNAVDTKPRTAYLSVGLGGEKPLAPCFDAKGRLVGFAVEHETALAAEEYPDVVRQGRAALAKKASP